MHNPESFQENEYHMSDTKNCQISARRSELVIPNE